MSREPLTVIGKEPSFPQRDGKEAYFCRSDADPGQASPWKMTSLSGEGRRPQRKRSQLSTWDKLKHGVHRMRSEV